ncbi:hypothetical protein [Bacillus sp. JCM 19041]|uniref:hypothetical protein n=1 Tax=Bacillus sp. JCM 19041 TaxID=1460637 RepID=UPI0006CF84C3
MNLVEVKIRKNHDKTEFEIQEVGQFNTDKDWRMNKQYVDADFVYAANDLVDKGIRKGYKLRIDFQNEAPRGCSVVTKIIDDKGYVESYYGQKYVAYVRVIDLRK